MTSKACEQCLNFVDSATLHPRPSSCGNDIRRNVHPDIWNHCPGVSNPMPEECYLELKASTMQSLSLIPADLKGTVDSLMTCQTLYLRVTAQVLRAVKHRAHQCGEPH